MINVEKLKTSIIFPKFFIEKYFILIFVKVKLEKKYFINVIIRFH